MAHGNDSATAVRIVDTRLASWVDPPEGDGFHGTNVKVKVLSRHDEGWVTAQLLWVPPGLASINPHHQAERHYHTTVREWVLQLEGELHYREYADMKVDEWKTVVFRRGVFLDRLPGPTSVHGMEPGAGRIHAVCLEIRDGRATAPGENGYLEQNRSITDAEIAAGQTPTPPPADAPARAPFGPLAGPGVIHATSTVRLYDTTERPWEAPAAGTPLAQAGGALVKPLAHAANAGPYFEVAYLPAGATDPAPARYQYVLEGSLETAAGLAAADAFVETPGEATPATAGPTGCVALRWRDPR